MRTINDIEISNENLHITILTNENVFNNFLTKKDISFY